MTHPAPHPADPAAQASRLESLLLLARDADRFEEELFASQPQDPLPLAPARSTPPRIHERISRSAPVHAPSSHRRRWTVGVLASFSLSLAAVLFFFSVQPPTPSSTSAPAIPQIGSRDPWSLSDGVLTDKSFHFDDAMVQLIRPSHPLPLSRLLPEPHQNVLLAMYEGTDPRTGEDCSDCQCVQVWSHDFGAGRQLADVNAGELIGASMQHACMPAPRRLVVVGLSGPASALPETDQQARDLVRCIVNTAPDHACSDRDSTLSSAAQSCVAADVKVRVQTVAWDR